MKKQVIFLIIIGAVALLALALFYFSGEAPSNDPVFSDKDFTDTPDKTYDEAGFHAYTLVSKEDAVTQDGRNIFQYSMHVPFFQNSPPTDGITAINAYFKEQADLFARITADYIAHAEEFFASESTAPAMPFSLQLDYRITLNTESIISAAALQQEYMGGAHGGAAFTGATFDARTGAMLTLGDISGDADTLLTLVADGVIAQEGEGLFDPTRQGVLEGFHNQDFYLTPEGITFVFQQYAIGPYAMGMVEFTVPFAEVPQLKIHIE